MNKYLFIFEDNKAANFAPLTHLRPIYYLRPGIRPIYQSILDSFSTYKPVFFCRSELEEIVSDRLSTSVNRFDSGGKCEIIAINGRVTDCRQIAEYFEKNDGNLLLSSGDDTVALRFGGDLSGDDTASLSDGNMESFIGRIKARLNPIEFNGHLYNYLWDMINDMDRAITADLGNLKKNGLGLFGDGRNRIEDMAGNFPDAHFINEGNICLSGGVKIMPTAVLDASHGPIYIEEGVEIQPYSYLGGPAYVGKDTLIVGGKIEGCSIGPVCRVGGEVEETIIQGYTNKYHAGFLGHAYVGEWVNFGAMSTNSDLKNDYSSVKVTLNGRLVDTGSLKVGSFIGDFTKTAIGTLLNTGINIGVCCNILGTGLVAEKEIPDFTWYTSKRQHEYRLDKALDVIKRTMARREKTLSESLEKRLTDIHSRRK
jgi:UDP-N-acetylglucosamine diphosphorylase/glucosamine-1-phosphate N-acetyltransferase